MDKIETKKDANLQIRINSELKRQFEDVCAKKYTTKASVLTAFIVEYIEKNK